jgi:4'-phosphopantetheinyl transferase
MSSIWDAEPPPPGPPPAGVIHVWRVLLDREPPRARLAALSPDERQRAARYRHPDTGRRFTAARAALRAVLGHYTGLDPAELCFTVGRYGKPELAGPGAAVRFNLSHSGGLALLAVATGREVGIDIEQVRPRPNAVQLVERYFSAAERTEFAGLSGIDQERGFLLGWTRKEAFVKAVGDGLQCPLDSFAVTMTPGRPAGLALPPEHAAAGWTVADLHPGEGYVAALVTSGGVTPVAGFEEKS